MVLTDFFWNRVQTFRHAAQEQPDFVVIGGDFVHNNPKTLAEQRDLFKSRYDPNTASTDFVDLILRRSGVVHFWDDHDYGENNGDKTFSHKQESLQALREYFPVYPLSAHGDWQRFSYGQADFFVLDSRSQRDSHKTPDGPNKSMLDGDNLGAEGQWAWLTTNLQESQARWKFILTPVPFNGNLKKIDAWYGFQDERQKLVDWIHAEKISGVIFLSGDIHSGGIDDGTNSDLPEMVVPSANGANCGAKAELGTWSVGTM